MGLRLGLAALVAWGVFAAGAACADDNDIVLGLSYGGTGPYVTSSRTTETAVDLAVREINGAGGVNGKKLRVVKFDTAGDPKQSALAVRRFAEDEGALAIVGPFSAAEARTAFAAGDREGITNIPNAASVPGITKGFKYAFRVTTTDDLALAALIDIMRQKNLKIDTAGIMYVNDLEGQRTMGAQVYPAVLGKAGVKIVGELEGFSMNAFDLSPQVAKLMQSKPDVVAVAAFTEQAMKAVAELRRQNFQGRMIGSLLFADPDFAKKVGPAGDGTLYMSWFYADSSEKARKFTADFNAENAARHIEKSGPHHVDASAYDTVYMLAQTMREKHLTGERSKLKEERAALRDALETMRFTGVIGPIRFNADHDAILPLYAIEVRNGGATLLGSVSPTE